MGLFSPYAYKNKNGEKFYLHMKEKGKVKLYFFSKEPDGALNSLPGGFKVIENEKSSLPFLKKKESLGLFTKKKEEKQQKEQPAQK